jgi:hypothetical protein
MEDGVGERNGNVRDHDDIAFHEIADPPGPLGFRIVQYQLRGTIISNLVWAAEWSNTRSTKEALE